MEIIWPEEQILVGYFTAFYITICRKNLNFDCFALELISLSKPANAYLVISFFKYFLFDNCQMKSRPLVKYLITIEHFLN